ncbi:phage tail protein [Pseudomonas sp. PWP3-1b2]|uniref:phage tail protein n=1 Tax=Pseudomonas sp. PWP3-1b2 TaxID=2804656 RepID=UPI003CF62A71
MTDQNSQFFAILTDIGKAKQANADALGIPWTFAQMGVGDANETKPIPNPAQTKLINERRRAPLNQVKVDPKNPSVIVAEQIIPESEGGWWILEIGLYDASGDLVAVANCAPTYKPLLSQGSGRTQVLRMNLIVSNTANIELKIDPSVVLATREYADNAAAEATNKLDTKQSVLLATTGPVVMNGVQMVDGVEAPVGSRVLVKNQAQSKDNGIYLTAAGAWSRTTDADSSAKVTPGLLVSVERGTTNADTLWLLVTDAPVVLGTTGLTFRNITEGLARLDSPVLVGDPKAPTPALFDKDKSISTTEFVQRALGNMAGSASYTESSTLTPADMGKLLILNFSGMLQLPDAMTLAVGCAVILFNTGSAEITVNPAWGQTITPGVKALTTFSLPPGMSAVLILESATSWMVTGGTAQDRYSPQFAGEMGASGYQLLPGGYIEQWGSLVTSAQNNEFNPVTFRVGFPKECLHFMATPSAKPTGNVGGEWVNRFSAVVTTSSPAPQSVTWRAIGR